MRKFDNLQKHCYFAELRYKCYNWSDEDRVKMAQEGWTNEIEKRTCEGYENFVFTQGVDSKAPGCGNCWCCQPDNSGKTVSVNKRDVSRREINSLLFVNLAVYSLVNEKYDLSFR